MEPMNLTDNLLTELKLSGIKATVRQRLDEARREEVGHEGFLNLLLEDEKDFRKNTRIKRLIKRASFKKNATLEQLDYAYPRGLDKKVVKDLAVLVS